MDFVSQVVAAKEITKQKMITEQYKKLLSDTISIKSKICAETFSEVKILCGRKDRLDKYLPEIDKLLQELELLKAVDNTSIDKLKTLNDELMYLKSTAQIDCLLSEIIKNENNLQTVHTILKCVTLLSDNEKKKDFKIFYSLTKERLNHYRSFIVLRALKIFNKSLFFKTIQTNNNEVTTQIEFDCKPDELSSAFQVLLLLNQHHLIEVSRKLFNNILILFLKTCKVNVSEQKLVISYEKKSSKMPPQLFVRHLNKVFNVLKRHLCVVEESGSNLLQFIGQNCCQNLTKLLVDNYLSCLDGNWDLMVEFYSLVHDLHTFGFISTSSVHDTMTPWEYIIWPKNSPPLSTNNNIVNYYLSDSEDDYRLKSSIISFTDSAIACIKKSILTTFIVNSFKIPPPESCKLPCSDESPSNTQFFTASVKDNSGRKDSITMPSEDILFFPQCRVSESIEELTSIISNIDDLIDAHKKHHEEDVGRSFRMVSQYTLLVHNILSFYLFYKRSETSQCPESSAIIYNNSMYLVRKLMTFDYVSSNAFIKKLEYHGWDELNNCIISQRNLLRNYFERLNDNTELPSDWTSCAYAAVAHLENLKACWHQILPNDIFHQALGYLCNNLLQQIITIVERSNSDEKVMKDFEEIESQVLLRISSLFQEPDRNHLGNCLPEVD